MVGHFLSTTGNLAFAFAHVYLHLLAFVRVCLHLGLLFIGNIPSATMRTESLIWWIIRCYI